MNLQIIKQCMHPINVKSAVKFKNPSMKFKTKLKYFSTIETRYEKKYINGNYNLF
jgi:hypothetical protein